MAINYNWDVANVDTYPSHTDSQDPANTKSDVIYNVHWRFVVQIKYLTKNIFLYPQRAICLHRLS